MEIILHLLPLTGAQKTVFQAAALESEHLFLPTNNRGGASSIPQERRERTTILLGYAPPKQLKTFPNLKWVQGWSAGVDPYLAPGALPEDMHLTSAVGAYGPAVSEHVLAMLLAIYKHLPTYRDQQRAHVWANLGPVGSLTSRTMLVAGADDISHRLAWPARALGAQRVIEPRRSAGCPTGDFDEIYGLGALDDLLPQADVATLALPHTPEIAGLISKARLLAMRPGAVLLNAGRGSVVDCIALAEVLCSGCLLGAELDITNPEPLPPGHPLQEAPSLPFIPHTVGGYNHMEATLERIKVVFLDNLRHRVEGRILRSQVR